jgi:hypothetical protein
MPAATKAVLTKAVRPARERAQPTTHDNRMTAGAWFAASTMEIPARACVKKTHGHNAEFFVVRLAASLAESV